MRSASSRGKDGEAVIPTGAELRSLLNGEAGSVEFRRGERVQEVAARIVVERGHGRPDRAPRRVAPGGGR